MAAACPMCASCCRSCSSLCAESTREKVARTLLAHRTRDQAVSDDDGRLGNISPGDETLRAGRSDAEVQWRDVDFDALVSPAHDDHRAAVRAIGHGDDQANAQFLSWLMRGPTVEESSGPGPERTGG